MPTYQYVCKKCHHELEELQSISDPPLVRCPRCGTDSLARVVGSGAGLIFKGSGFYLTDYVKKGDKKASSSETNKEDKKGSSPAPSKEASDKGSGNSKKET